MSDVPERVRTKIMKNIWGTWELNPGPNAGGTRCQPTELLRFFVYIMENIYYNEKTKVNEVKQKKTRGNSNTPVT